MSYAEAEAGLIDQITRTLQIIIFAMVTGLAVFLGIVIFLGPGVAGRKAPAPAPAPAPVPAAAPGAPAAAPAAPEVKPMLPVLTVAAFTFAVVLVPLSLLVPRLVSESARRQIAATKGQPGKAPPGVPAPTSDAGRLLATYQIQKIIGAALNEGPAFFALIAYMMEGTAVALGLALALIVGVALRFPQRAQVTQWVDAQLERLTLDRQSL